MVLRRTVSTRSAMVTSCMDTAERLEVWHEMPVLLCADCAGDVGMPYCLRLSVCQMPSALTGTCRAWLVVLMPCASSQAMADALAELERQQKATRAEDKAEEAEWRKELLAAVKR
jgi:hypothetical protein